MMFRVESYLTFCIVTIIFIGVLGIVTMALALAFSFEMGYDNVSAYECGFMPFEEARLRLNIKFYLISILFILFDLEVVLIFPWVVVFRLLGLLGFYAMVYFLVLLAIGFSYEWQTKSLDWINAG